MALIDRKLQFPSKMLPLLYETSLTCQVNGVYIKSLDCSRKDERPQPTLLAKSSIFSSKIPLAAFCRPEIFSTIKFSPIKIQVKIPGPSFFNVMPAFYPQLSAPICYLAHHIFFRNIIIVLYVCAMNWLSITMRWTFDENYTHHRLETISLVSAGALNEI